MKSFFGNVFVRMNEGRLTPELMYTPASAFLQFFLGGGGVDPNDLGHTSHQGVGFKHTICCFLTWTKRIQI